jgi:mycothiol synthase
MDGHSMPQPTIIRPFDPTNEEYAAIVQVYNLSNPYEPGSAESWRHWDQHRDPAKLFQRYVAEQGTRIAGYGFSMKPDPRVNAFHLAIFPHSQNQSPEMIAEFYNAVMDGCLAHGPEALFSHAKEDDALKSNWLAQNGFRPAMRYPLSLLTVAEFDPTPYAGLIDRLAAEGIEIVSVAELAERDDDWQRQIHRLLDELNQDVPTPASFTIAPFEQYAQREFEDPYFMPECWFVAMKGDQYVGFTAFSKTVEDITLLHTSFTGVRRADRRRGIATALKLRSFEVAKRMGTRLIQTNNEENNPMFDLNLKLGFEPQPADVDWEKRLSN